MTDIEERYRARRTNTLEALAERLELTLKEIFKAVERIDQITARAKGLTSFINKSVKADEHGNRKYSDPLRQIQDQVGARIVTFYLHDVDRIEAIVKTYFRYIQLETLVPETEEEFSYFGRHFVAIFPPDLWTSDMDAEPFFELQIKTLFQHAWSEANHDIGYKQLSRTLDSDERRSMAFASAQAWGADQVFNMLSQREASTE